MHHAPRLVVFTPVRTGCPVDIGRLSDTRRTYAYNLTTRRSVDRLDNWRDSDSTYYHPFEMTSNEDSSDGDYRLNKWWGFTEFTIADDSAPATQWSGERLLIEYCCGEQSRLGNPRNFVDNACQVVRLTEKDT